MARHLSPFVKHLGEAKHRCRQVVISAERVEAAAIAAAGLSGSHADLAKAIADQRQQLAMLEDTAQRWAQESAQPTR